MNILAVPPWLDRIENYEIGLTKIQVGYTPFMDSERFHNQINLANLPMTYVAKVYPDQNKDEDGVLSWEYPIEMEVMAKPDIKYWVDKAIAPLEIGNLKMEQLALRIGQWGFCAWWQYGSEEILLLHELIPAIQ